MAYVFPDTRDQRRIANSDSKTLLQNWVEERAVKPFDGKAEKLENGDARFFKGGHKGLLTIKDNQPINDSTTYASNYTIQDQHLDLQEAKGIRYKMTEQMLTKKLVQQMEEDENLRNDWCDEQTKFVSETGEKFVKPGFVHKKPAPTAKHDLYSEMPISYWTEKKNRATGVTQMKILDSPFKKNTAFSKPIGETYDTAMPYDLENYPYMAQQSNNNGPLM